MPRRGRGRRASTRFPTAAAEPRGLVDPGERAHVGTAERELRGVREVELAAQDGGAAIDDRDRDLVHAVLEMHEGAAGQRAVRHSLERCRKRLTAGGAV